MHAVVEGIEGRDQIKREKGMTRRRKALLDRMDRGMRDGTFSITRGVLDPDIELRVLFAEILSDVERDENRRSRPSSETIARKPKVRLRTVDGRPFAAKGIGARVNHGIKYGVEQANAKRLVTLKMQGIPIIKRVDYPEAEFEVDPAEAWWLLTQFGYRCTLTQRHWHLYEVGGPFEAEIREKYGAPTPPPQPTAEDLFAQAEAIRAQAEAMKAAEDKAAGKTKRKGD